MLRKVIFSFLVLSVSLFATGIVVKDIYVRAVPPNLQNSASFMKIMNTTNKDIYLTGAKSSGAKTLELHEHKMNNGMIVMREVKSIKVPAKGMVELKPGGFHVMLIGLNKIFKKGDNIKNMQLDFSNGEVIKLKNIPIKSVMSGMKKMNMKMN
jgi:copper(I)-binding protein